MKISDLKDYTVIGGTNTGVPDNFIESSTEKPTGQKVLDAGTKVANFFGFKGVADQFGADIARSRANTDQEKNLVEYPKLKEVVGSALQGGANFIPGVGAGAKLGTKIAAGLGTGYAMDVGAKLQNKNKTVGQSVTPGIGTAVGAGLPVAGVILKPVTKIVSRLFTGLGSGLSGVSTDSIEKIIQNPETAQRISDKLAKSGNNRILEENTKTIINGVTKIKREAGDAYRKGLEELSEVDINPENISEGITNALEKNGISIADGSLNFSAADFVDPNVQKKAENVINSLSEHKDFSGKGVRKLMDFVESAKFKTAPDGERQAYNALLGDIKNGLKEGINKSTDKLSEINRKYSTDLQLAETVEDIFGGVNYKSLPELVKASQKMESLFNQKGLAPEVVDDFLNRIGEKPADFKTSEAVRQISNKKTGANAKGLSPGEVIQQVTSSIITPKTVKYLAIKTGLAEKQVLPFLRQLKPSARAIVIQSLLQSQQRRSE